MSTPPDAQRWIERLQLEQHPEGGWFRETYRSELALTHLPSPFSGARPASTAIYFLLAGAEFSAFHRIASDELWHFYDGSPLLVQVINPSGVLETIRLGRNPQAGEVLQAAVPAGCWFGSSLAEEGSYALVGCTVAPGFDFSDFQMGRRDELVDTFSQHRTLIEQLTRADLDQPA